MATRKLNYVEANYGNVEYRQKKTLKYVESHLAEIRRLSNMQTFCLH